MEALQSSTTFQWTIENIISTENVAMISLFKKCAIWTDNLQIMNLEIP